jgi:sulfatase maturation enzyme AslB (radical SAM superfamily)
MEDNIYHNIMFMLRSLQSKGLKIEEIQENPSIFNTRTQIKELFSKNNIEVFKSIDGPMQWQKNQRDEW